jgi:phosphoribosylanthranilate isomerase
MRTRIKICGLTRSADIAAAASAGADALGFVFYASSPRYVTPTRAAQLLALVPPMITTVGLFVNATPQEVADVVRIAPVSILQFHGDETVEQCIAAAELANRPFLRAIRVRADTNAADLLEYEAQYRAVSSQTGGKFAGLLLDAFVEGYGGGGKVFDWSLIPEELAPRVVLSGGLSVQNATDAVLRVRPWAVDISSGVELQKGIKDAAAINAFIEAVRLADLAINAA